MPNWSVGIVRVKGKPENIENFCKLFLFEEDTDKDDNKGKNKYFARSFIHQDWKDFKKEHLGENEAEFDVDFAWSCWSCLFEGYPTKNKKENPKGFGNCVTLEWAMKEHNVSVEIETEEGGMAFEEHITTENKKPIYSSKEMPSYDCQKCGSKQVIPSSYKSQDLEDVECNNCEAIGKWKDELAEIIKEKISMIKNKNGVD